MRNRIKQSMAASLGLLMLSFFYACDKQDVKSGTEPGPDQSKLSVYLTDGPAYFDKVMVDIQSIAVKVDTSQKDWDGHDHHAKDWLNQCFNHDQDDTAAVWDTLSINPGVYNLLDFANGADTLLTSDVIPKGRILAFRLTLGDQNSLVKDSVTYPVQLFPGWEDIYIRVYGASFEKVSSGHFKIWIDFDAGRSIVKARAGSFYLLPVLKAFAISNTGRVEGQVLPADAYPVVSVYNDTDTAYAIPGRSGFFMVRGLEEGDYTVYINASNGYQDTVLQDVSVKAGGDARLGNIHLHK